MGNLSSSCPAAASALVVSDFPSATPEQAIAGLWKVNDLVDGTRFPRFPQDAIRRIIDENWKQVLDLDGPTPLSAAANLAG